MSMLSVLSHLYLGWIAYFIAVASPGPAVLAITGTAMTSGRRSALVYGFGVLTGSLFWGVMAAIGLSALMARYGHLIFVLKLLGGLYLLYLSVKAFRSAFARQNETDRTKHATSASIRSLYLRGLGLHLTNPKPIFAWLALVSLGLPRDAPITVTWIFIAGCMVIGCVTFSGFAFVFSVPAVLTAYQSARRFIEAGMGAFFAFAGFKMLTSKI